MSSMLKDWVDKTVHVITSDGRTLQGILVSYDQTMNLILKKAIERVTHTPDDDDESAEVDLGIYLVRGDQVCTLGLVDMSLNDSIDWTKVKGSAIGGTKHS